ncbi:MAG: hypothetical protein ACI828_000275 [Flavobacteriales bacterium]|jgi:hypothetical protein
MLFFFVACASSDEPGDIVTEQQTLAILVAQSAFEIDTVIACASGSSNSNEIVVYVYPRANATALKYFETEDASVDENDYNAYTEVTLPAEDFFNGYLKTFTRETEVERWVIISFRESGKLHLSGPIRLKHISQNTVFSSAVTIDQSILGSPVFSWSTLASAQNAIYFQVVSNGMNDLLSGTYTTETDFQYYEVDNVVLNITTETPPDLSLGNEYGFTLMGVSEDNWVNDLVQIPFVAN